MTVCDQCLQASCWQGIFYCGDAVNAGTVEYTVAQLRALDREHSDYWKPAPQAPGQERGDERARTDKEMPMTWIDWALIGLGVVALVTALTVWRLVGARR